MSIPSGALPLDEQFKAITNLAELQLSAFVVYLVIVLLA